MASGQGVGIFAFELDLLLTTLIAGASVPYEAGIGSDEEQAEGGSNRTQLAKA